MTWLLTILILLVFIACVATCYTEGMWSNAITLINVVTAALLAVNFFEPVARWLDDWDSSYTYIWDFLALWGLFSLFMLVFRLLTDRLSRVKVRFLKLADRIGSGLLSAWIGWVMVCFTMLTLHTAPMSRTFLFDGFQPGEKMVLGMAPDQQWLNFVQRTSKGVFSHSEVNPFDPTNQFINTYETRRTNLEAHIDKTNTLRVR